MATPYFQDDLVTLYRANALDLPLDDDSADLVVTSPPYFGLRSYKDGGDHYDGQIGAEATPTEFVDALIAATREMMRVTKPSGSIWVNLGDKYVAHPAGNKTPKLHGVGTRSLRYQSGDMENRTGVPRKSLIGIPWRYAIRCIDDLGLILRAEVIWSKPNGLPESVKDRARRSHEHWFHFTLEPRYYSAVDEIREPASEANPLGRLPGSVWTIATEPLKVPDHLGIDHFAAFPTEWPRRIITGWSPRGVCVECGAGRRPVVERGPKLDAWREHNKYAAERGDAGRIQSISGQEWNRHKAENPDRITGYACDCPEPTAPTTPGVVLDPFSGTGTTALVASVLGRHGIGVDMSEDYCRLAKWRTTDPKQRDKVARKAGKKPTKQSAPVVPDLFNEAA